jgi:hypothetical protein
MGLNFGDMVLSQPNLIRAKKRHFHYQTHIKICLSGLICLWRWEVQRRASIQGYVLINDRLGQMIMMFGEFILNDDLFKKSFENLEPKVL